MSPSEKRGLKQITSSLDKALNSKKSAIYDEQMRRDLLDAVAWIEHQIGVDAARRRARGKYRRSR